MRNHPQIKFGTDGWRAIIGKDFNLANVQIVAQAISKYLIQTYQKKRSGLRVAVGYDTRSLSRQAAHCISQVLSANRIQVVLARQPLPTPAISYRVRSKRLSLGVMVTASHNPPCFNGIKVKDCFGAPAGSEITSAIESLILQQGEDKISIQQPQKKSQIKISNLISAYLKFLTSYLDIRLLKKGRLQVLVDSMHGTANSYLAMILKNTPCKVTTIHRRYDSSFAGIKPEPIASCLREAAYLIRHDGFDLGLATDGDGDRIAALDEHGNFISPQEIISLLLLHLIQHRGLTGAVVKTVSGTALLERIAKRYKLKIYQTPIGFKHIAHLMKTEDILIGGEEAGGIGFKDYLPERDGCLAGLLLLEMMIARNKSLADLLQDLHREFGQHCYLRKDLKYRLPDKDKVKANFKKICQRRYFSGIQIKKVQDYDGLKFYLADDSWVLLRFSGTEPVLRIYAESDSLTKARKLIAAGKSILNR